MSINAHHDAFAITDNVRSWSDDHSRRGWMLGWPKLTARHAGITMAAGALARCDTPARSQNNRVYEEPSNTSNVKPSAVS